MNNPDQLDWEPYDRHWIRLRGPWDVAWLSPPQQAADQKLGVPRRIQLPVDWQSLFGADRGGARFTRRFQRPTNLGAGERVILTLRDVRAIVKATLNSHPLTPLSGPAGDPDCLPDGEILSFDITAFLQQSNSLTLDITVASLPGDAPCGLWRPVLLEIITAD